MRLKFVLPLPPSINVQYTQRDGRRVLSGEANNYKQSLLKEIRRLRAQGAFAFEGYRIQPGVYLSLHLTFYFKTPMRRDLDNGLKLAQDILCTGLEVNDNSVVQVYLEKRVDKKEPRLEVVVEPLSFWQFEQEMSLFKEERPTDVTDKDKDEDKDKDKDEDKEKQKEKRIDLRSAVKPLPPKPKGAPGSTVTTLEELMEKFGWE